jgi:hypothetical protein
MADIKCITRFVGVLGEDDQPVNEFKQFVQEFDKNQNCIKEIEFNPGGEVENASGYTFNDQNKKIEEIHYFNQDEIGELIRYKLNDEGKTVEIETTYADGAKSVKKINRSKNLIEAVIYDEDGDLEGEEIVKLNNDGRPLEEIQYDEDKNIVRRFTYEYDKEGNVITRIEFGENNIFIVKVIFKYDKQSNLAGLEQFSEKGRPIGSTIYDYDNKGNQILMQTDRHIQRSAYDKNGKLMNMEIMNRVNNLVESFNEYKYDDHGRVIEERTFEIGETHQLEPGIFGRSGSNLQLTRYEYEFFDE